MSTFIPGSGDTYFSIHFDNDKKKFVVKRHFFDNHQFDFKMISSDNCYNTKDTAQEEANALNNNPPKQKLYKQCELCHTNTMHLNNVCVDCGNDDKA